MKRTRTVDGVRWTWVHGVWRRDEDGAEVYLVPREWILWVPGGSPRTEHRTLLAAMRAAAKEKR